MSQEFDQTLEQTLPPAVNYFENKKEKKKKFDLLWAYILSLIYHQQ